MPDEPGPGLDPPPGSPRPDAPLADAAFGLKKLAELAGTLGQVKATLRELADRLAALEGAEARRSAARGGALARYRETQGERQRALIRLSARASEAPAASLGALLVEAVLQVQAAAQAFEAVVLLRLGLSAAEEEEPRGRG